MPPRVNRFVGLANDIDPAAGGLIIASMRCLVLAVLLLAGGCAGKKASGLPAPGPTATPPPAAAGADQQPAAPPATARAGKVVWVNQPGRFVVLKFPREQVPRPGEAFSLYRGGQKTGEVRIGSSRDDDRVVADVLSGDAQLGDEARENPGGG
jgi:hypothetical protein